MVLAIGVLGDNVFFKNESNEKSGTKKREEKIRKIL